jgi:hypothetical protein
MALTKKKLEEIEKKILEQRVVRLQGFYKSQKKELSLKEFLINFFTQYNNENKTIYKDDKSTQTDVGKRRSLGDIFLICKYYYPKATLKEVVEILYNDLFNDIPRFRSSACYQIKKRVFYQGNANQKSEVYDLDDNDEWKVKFNDWKEYKEVEEEVLTV